MNTQSTILVVDDDTAHRTMLRTLLGRWGYKVIEADDGDSAISRVEERPYDLIMMDIRMMRVSGLEALVKIKTINPSIPIIIMTAYSSVETAVEALKNGAYDYLMKPLDFDELKISLERAMEHRRLREENLQLREQLGSQFDRRNIIGRSTAMEKLMETVLLVAASDVTVLITGESGTGKELIAGAIHYNSPRRDGPFVKINCAAITETLLESELFGHEKGSFTGADRKKEGKFRQADGGTLFLDEVSEMSLAMQVKLLRVVQEREVTRVGGDEVLAVDVRVITATNKNLEKEAADGRFRQDLYYRINVVSIEVPPLVERKEDIPLLAQHFLSVFSEKNQKKIKGFSPQAMDLMLKYDWPGNIRELMNVVERAVVLSRAEFLDDGDLSIHERGGNLPVREAGESLSLEEVEKNTIVKTLERAGGNKSEAARLLGITRKTLRDKLKKYSIAD
ncbi:MAG: sigma-54 dependent transcriptional regulator [Deltaproteobacteria bacterium]|nr:sigma-54 dependent transcriptional regulator [Deltaproteobacteria bacterium]